VALNNGNSGVGIYGGASNNIIGGTTTTDRNIISGNLYDGIGINGNGTNSNIISGNYIGTNITGTLAIPNGNSGIAIQNSAKFTQIGGSTLDSANTIAYNNEYGVLIDGLGANYNNVTHNSIYSNNNKGIAVLNLANLGITAPVITSFDGAQVTGTSSANAVIEFFADSEEEGKIFIDTAKADVSGNFSKQLNLSGIPDNFNITATQTSNNNTSEFSVQVGISPSAPQNLSATGGNLQVTLRWNPNSESDLHKYNIYRGTTSPVVTLIDSVIVSSSADTNYTDNNVTPDTTYYYRITAVDSAWNESNFSNEVYATPFEIILTVLTPNGGENWLVGSSQTIKWLYNQVDTVRIDYSTDNGSNWIPIDTTVSPSKSNEINPFRDNESFNIKTSKKRFNGLRNNNKIKSILTETILADTGSFEWTIPNTPSAQCLVRITDKTNPGVGDSSDTIFTIAFPTEIVVTNTADNGPGTLRQALLDAGKGAFITFDTAVFPPGSPATISLTSGELPAITQGSITIDASNAGVILDGSSLAGGNGLFINSDSNRVKGLQIQKFNGDGISIMGNSSPSYNIIGGNRTIGHGPNGEGNTVINCSFDGIDLYDSTTTFNIIIGNYVGINVWGLVAMPNFRGITIRAPFNTIGSSIPGERNIISGNIDHGIWINSNYGHHNTIIGNYIGTNATGTDSVGNGAGVMISDFDGAPTNNTIGGSNENERNLISGNRWNGILIMGVGVDSNYVIGNYIGTDISGINAIPNLGRGISIVTGASNNFIGGNTIGKRNVISGNAMDGIEVTGVGTRYNMIIGNFIGVNSDGTQALPNQLKGIDIHNGPKCNIIGGDSSIYRNIISGNILNGIHIVSFGTDSNIVRGNYVGTDVSGTSAIGNGWSGVQINDGASFNIIGGNNPGKRNLLSGNIGAGIVISNSSNFNQIMCNYIGTDINGTLSLGNGAEGIFIENSSNNIIGGSNPGEGNLISANSLLNISIRNFNSTYNTVIGNYIGVDVTGTVALDNGNGGVGLYDGARNNVIGGSNPIERNIISGNNYNGIWIKGTGTDSNIVSGNYIGADYTGNVALGNGNQGVHITGGPKYNVIGGQNEGERNIISANGFDGVLIYNSDENIIVGNFIGTDVNGTSSLSNQSNGISISDSANYNNIENNVISGNSSNGISFLISNNNIVTGNYIGTDVTGNNPVPNGGKGVSIHGGSNNNVVGGITQREINLISGNNGDGIWIAGSGTNYNKIISNIIGIDSSKTIALPNGTNGITITNSAKFTQIGGSTVDSANTIAYNNEYGVRVDGLGTNYNKVTHNSIYSNINKGIAVLNLANLGIAAPVITLFDGTLIIGTSSASAVIEFFTDSEEEGKIFIDTISADVSGNFSKQLDLSGIPDNFNITATQTLNKNTSEFSVQVGIPPSAPQNLAATGGNIQVTLHWNPNIESDLHKYNIYCGTTSPAVTLIDSVVVSSSADTIYIDNNVTPDTTYYYRITAVDSAGNESNFSNEVNAMPFEIILTVLSPNGGEQWLVGSSQTIKWLYSQVDTVRIDYSTDNGSNWIPIDTTVSPSMRNEITPFRDNESFNLEASKKSFNGLRNNNKIKTILTETILADTGSFEWTIPNTPSAQCLIRITDITNPLVDDSSDTIFTIAFPTEIVVTSTADNGPGTLRQALLDAVNGTFITFDAGVFPPSNPATISLTSGGLPTITQGSITVDASNAGVILDGSMIGNANGFHINSDSNSIKGLQIQYFTGNGIGISGNNSPSYNIIGGDRTIGTGRNGGGNTIIYCSNGIAIYDSASTNNKIIGNYVGIDFLGITAMPNTIGIKIRSPNNIMGSEIQSERNVLSGNINSGIRIETIYGHHNTIIGNYIGTNATGTNSVGNGIGVIIRDGGPKYNIVGGVTPSKSNLISGNNVDGGIWIGDVGSDSNLVIGNYIGTNVNGTNAIGNQGSGIFVGHNSRYTSIKNNIISGNTSSGIDFYNSNNNTVIGNYIGTNVTGNDFISNGVNGITLHGGSSNNIIGGTTVAERNIISGNSMNGIVIENTNSDSNNVYGNFIGVNVLGLTALPNGGHGIGIWNGPKNNLIGGDTPEHRNIISGNILSGIGISGASTDSNSVKGNYIGTDLSGTVALGNQGHGVQINVLAAYTKVQENIISGNSGPGIGIWNNSSNNEIIGNYIGTDVSGTLSLGNTAEGIVITDSPNNIIGGSNSGDRNIISGNNGSGIDIRGADSYGNIVNGNYIGVDILGSTALPNGGNGIGIYNGAKYNVIGGDTPEFLNVISGNLYSGIGISNAGTDSNIVSGNYIGTNSTGTVALGNQSHGVLITELAAYTKVQENIISGNGGPGIGIWNNSGNNEIFGNYIGTDVSGSLSLGNTAEGIIIDDSPNNIIGGSSPGERNIISANSLNIGIRNPSSTGNIVKGNFIGTDATGTVALNNGNSGVGIYGGASNNIIGGTTTTDRNIISGNLHEGIWIGENGTDNNIIQGNYIGTDKSGITGLGNDAAGIAIHSGAKSNIIKNNIMSANYDGIWIGTVGTDSNVIINNKIGTDVSGSNPIPNVWSGIVIWQQAKFTQIGGS
ncbi:MAG: hypothetical protein ABIJ97_11570, partial [Bacteroidota bacterium]